MKLHSSDTPVFHPLLMPFCQNVCFLEAVCVSQALTIHTHNKTKLQPKFEYFHTSFVSTVRWSSSTHWRFCWSWRCTSGTVGPIHSPHRNQSRSKPVLTNPSSTATLITSVSRDCFHKKTLRAEVQMLRVHSETYEGNSKPSFWTWQICRFPKVLGGLSATCQRWP